MQISHHKNNILKKLMIVYEINMMNGWLLCILMMWESLKKSFLLKIFTITVRKEKNIF